MLLVLFCITCWNIMALPSITVCITFHVSNNVNQCWQAFNAAGTVCGQTKLIWYYVHKWVITGLWTVSSLVSSVSSHYRGSDCWLGSSGLGELYRNVHVWIYARLENLNNMGTCTVTNSCSMQDFALRKGRGECLHPEPQLRSLMFGAVTLYCLNNVAWACKKLPVPRATFGKAT